MIVVLIGISAFVLFWYLMNVIDFLTEKKTRQAMESNLYLNSVVYEASNES